MNKTKSWLGAIAAAVCLVASPVDAQIKLRTLQTENLRLVYYDEEHAYVIPHLARCFENSMRFHRRLFNYTPSEPVTVLLQDFDDHGYAGTTTLPVNYLTLGIEPFEYVYETSPTNERINWVMSHELLHIVASDQATGSDRFFRSLFGGKVVASSDAPLSMLYSYLTAPRRFAPRWYHEGMAVFLETWMAGGYGRALGGYDEMVFRTMVADDSYFYDLVGLESEGTTTDFQIGQVSYLYGTRFISYLAYHNGPDKVIDWVNRADGSKSNFGAQFKHVFGRDLDGEWQRWIAWEHEWQNANLDSIREYPVTPYRVLSERPLGSVSRMYFDADTRTIYGAVNYPGEFAHITAIDVDTWQTSKVAEIATPALYYVASLAFDPVAKSIFFTTDNSRQWRDLNVADVATGNSTPLVSNFRTGDLAFNRQDESIWGIQHHNGKSRIVRVPKPYDDWQDILPLPFGKDVFDVDISPDGQFLTAALIEVTGRQRLVRFRIDELMGGGAGYDVLYEFEKNSPANFVYSPDGRYLFGTSYYTGASNIFRFDFETQQMDCLTNSTTGFFRPVPVSSDSLIAFHYTAEGFLPVMIANRAIEDVNPVRFLGQEIVETHPVVKSWMLEPPSVIDIDSLTLVSGDYSGFGNIEFGNVYPIVESYKDRTAFGVRLSFMEPVGLHAADVSLSVSPSETLPDDEKFHVSARYQTWPWQISATYNKANFYDLFGPTKTSRKGYSLGVEYGGVLINDRPRHLDYKIRVAGYGGLDRLPDYQNVAASFDKYLTMSAGLSFRSVRKTIGGLEAEKGTEWSLSALGNFVNSDNFPRVWGEVAKGFLLPLDHSSVWLRSAAGYSSGGRDEPFANFFFGGFGNNWVDHSQVKRYREYYSFPGVELNALSATQFGKLMLEWTLPPVRFRHFGFTSLYANWAHVSFFANGIGLNWDDDALSRTLWNAGVQLDLKVVIFSAMSSTFSLGYGSAFEDRERPSHEFMISLRIL